MSPLPSSTRLREYGVKGAHAALRLISSAPEQRVGRRLAAAEPSGTRGKRVVILTPRDWSVHVQWETMIGHALRARGADVRFITCGGELEICDRVNTHEGPPVPCRSCRRYVNDSVAAHGFAFETIRDAWAPGAESEWPELDELSLEQLRQVVDIDSGLPLGELVRIPVSWFLMGARLDLDPLAPITYRRFLRAARRVARGLNKLLSSARPDVVVLLNGLLFFESIASALCERAGIDVVTYERGFIKETLLFRRGAPACLGDVAHLWPHWKDVPLSPEEEARLDTYLDDRRHGRRTIDRYWVSPTFDVVEGRTEGRLVSLFTNLTWDSAVIGQELAFPSIQDWITRAVEVFERRPADHLAIRIHPAEVKLPGKQTRESLSAYLRERFERLPPNVRVIEPEDPQSSYPLMAASDLGLVFTSTTGLELALAGRPVIVSGRTHYRGKGFTVDVQTPEGFERAVDDVLANPDAFAPDRALARRYAYLFFFRAPVAAQFVEEHAPGLARITVQDPADLAPGRSADVDRIATLILDGEDPLERAPAEVAVDRPTERGN